MKFWIDVEDMAGNKLGAGPVRTMQRARIVTLLDRIGTFEFDVPASDKRAATLLRPMRVARIWGVLDGVVTELGAGIIEKRAFVAPDTLRIQGNDLFIEFVWRLTHGLSVYEEITESPLKVLAYEAGVFTAHPLMHDGNPSTSSSVTLLDTDSFLFIGHDKTFNIVDFTINTGNTSEGNINYGFSDERLPSGVFPLGQWRAPGVTDDGTAAPEDVLLSISGEVEFPRPGNWQLRTINGIPLYWLRLDPDADLTAIDIAEIAVKLRTATATISDLEMIMGYAPSGWSLDGYDSTEFGTFSLFASETVFNAFLKTAEKTREHFRRGVGRSLVWLRKDKISSGIRAVARLDSIAAERNPHVIAISALEELEDASGVVSRIYPRGKGNGPYATSLFDCSSAAVLSIPASYEVNTNEGYIARKALEDGTHPDFPGMALRIEHSETWSEIGASDGGAAPDQAASDELLYAAFNWLQQHDEVQKFYQLSVVGLKRIVKVGETIEVEYRKASNEEGGGLTIDINTKRDGKPLLVQGTTLEIDESGIATTSLQVSTTDRYPESDSELLARQIEQMTAYRMHSQNVGMYSVR